MGRAPGPRNDSCARRPTPEDVRADGRIPERLVRDEHSNTTARIFRATVQDVSDRRGASLGRDSTWSDDAPCCGTDATGRWDRAECRSAASPIHARACTATTASIRAPAISGVAPAGRKSHCNTGIAGVARHAPHRMPSSAGGRRRAPLRRPATGPRRRHAASMCQVRRPTTRRHRHAGDSAAGCSRVPRRPGCRSRSRRPATAS